MSTDTSTFLRNLSGWAETAAAQQLDQSQDLSGAVCKIARENDLNPDQIKRLCEAANHCVYETLFKSADDRLFDFPVADYAKIVATIHAGEEEKSAEVSSDYDGAPRFHSSDIVDMCFRNMFPKQANDSVAFGVLNHRAEMRYELNRKLAALAELQTIKVGNEYELTEAEDELYRQMRRAILNGEDLDDVFQVFTNTSTGGVSTSSTAFEKIVDRLKDENLIDPMSEVDQYSPDVRLVNRDTPVAQASSIYHKAADEVRVAERAVKLAERAVNDLCGLIRATEN